MKNTESFLTPKQRKALYQHVKKKISTNKILSVGMCYFIDKALGDSITKGPLYHPDYRNNSVYYNMSFLPELLAQKPKNIKHEQSYWWNQLRFEHREDNPRIIALNKAIELCP